MNFAIDINTVASLLVVAALGFLAKFGRNIDRRLTRIEAILESKHWIKHED